MDFFSDSANYIIPMAMYLYTLSLCNVAFVMDVAHAFPMTPNLAKNREDMRHPKRYIYL